MSGKVNGWIDKRMNEWIGGWTNEQMDDWVDKWVNKWMNKEVPGWKPHPVGCGHAGVWGIHKCVAWSLTVQDWGIYILSLPWVGCLLYSYFHNAVNCKHPPSKETDSRKSNHPKLPDEEKTDKVLPSTSGWLRDPRVCIPPKLTTPSFYFSSTYCKTLYSLVFCFILGMYSLLWLLNFILLKDIIHQKKSCVLCTWFYFHLTYYFFMITDTIYLCNRWWWWPGPCSTILWFV